MKSLKKTTLASLVGAAALAAAGAANATIVVGGENGYEFSVDGNINQFFTYTDQDGEFGGVANAADIEEAEVRNGLLPTFFGFNVSMPEVNGLKVGARVSISPSTNAGSYTNLGNGAMEQREAFATIDGSFGQILAGKALGLYGSHNILTDQTLYGVGAGATGNLQTTLGRIGWGYDYAGWDSQIRWTSPDMNGFKAAFAVVDSNPFTGGAPASGVELDSPRYEGDLSYATAFDGGSFMGWVSGLTQDFDSYDAQAVTVGATLNLAGFEFMAQYYDNEGIGMGVENVLGFGYNDRGNGNVDERDGDGYIVQAGYNFGGTTRLVTSYGESNMDKANSLDNGNFIEEQNMWVLGIYHDVTSNLKLVAEYSDMEREFTNGVDGDADTFAIGGFVTW